MSERIEVAVWSERTKPQLVHVAHECRKALPCRRPVLAPGLPVPVDVPVRIECQCTKSWKSE